MNLIKAQDFQTLYASAPHMMIWIDGEPLDCYLDRRASGRDLAGLVPTWLDWMIDDAEQKIVHARMLPVLGGFSRVPLLMCPDDLNFSCSLVVAEVAASADEIQWTRIGLDSTGSLDPRDIGSVVEWFDEVGPLRFQRSDYNACLEAFRQQNQIVKSGGSSRLSQAPL